MYLQEGTQICYRADPHDTEEFGFVTSYNRSKFDEIRRVFCRFWKKGIVEPKSINDLRTLADSELVLDLHLREFKSCEDSLVKEVLIELGY